MTPYLSAYLQLTSPDGCTVEVLNGCRAKANFDKPGRSTRWVANEPDEIWPGYCNWAWDTGSYEDGTDPWYDPHNPATQEVAGFFVDPPDGDGHGFYLEPSGSKRIVQATTFEPLEMYFTGTIVSCTSRGEEALLRWMHKTLSDCSAGCYGWQATVYTQYPCEDDFSEAAFDACGDQTVPASLDTGEPPRPDLKCGPASSLEPGGDPAPYLDTGKRTIGGIVYRGYEQLDEGIEECSGNRYKFCFDVVEHCAVLPGILVAEFDPEWDKCRCLCTNRYEICRYQPHDPCGDLTTSTPAVQRPIVASNTRPITDNRGGTIAIPGRYIRPDKVNVSSILTPVLGDADWVPRIVLTGGETTTPNLRISVWQAIDNVPPPDTEEGWCVYRGIQPCWRADIAKISPRQQYCIHPDGSCTTTCPDGSVINAERLIDKTSGPIRCGGRFWVTVEACCEPAPDFTARVWLHQMQTI